MQIVPTHTSGPSLLLIEGVVTLIGVGIALWLPRLGAGAFARVERAFRALARRKKTSVLVVGLSALFLRLAILPISPIPHPYIHDDFSFLLAADTYASGRLTNPTPPMWTHFETFYVDMKPTYQSMYFPAQGLLLAAAKVIAGNPWFGVLASTSLMCAAICWMLQGWLPASWALLGGIIAILRLGLFSYWIDSYFGAGSLVALGGALVLGALPRLTKTARMRYGILMAVGIVILELSRPYEGMLLCLPVLAVLVWWSLFGKNRPRPSILLRRAMIPIALIVAATVWMGYYNDRVFGSPLTLPYSINHSAYGMPSNFVWEPPPPQREYRHKELQKFYAGKELRQFQSMRTLPGFLRGTLIKVATSFVFYAGIVLLIPLIMWRRVVLDRRTRFFILCIAVLIAGTLPETWLLPHYISPFTAVFYVLGLQAMRHLRLWKPEGRPAGIAMSRVIVTVCVLMVGLRLSSSNLGLMLSRNPILAWYGSGDLGAPRARAEARLERLPGKQLAIVQYSPDHNPLQEWVENGADIDRSKIIWARDMGAEKNQALIHYYKGRNVWLVQPDTNPVKITPYPLAGKDTAAVPSGHDRIPVSGRRENMATAQ